MMKTKLAIRVMMAFVVFVGVVQAGLLTEISYSTKQISQTRWIYEYDVRNLSIEEGVAAFTIWFKEGDYANLAMVTQEPLLSGWDQIVWQPNLALASNGAFDVLTKTQPIRMGESISGFSVEFDWLKQKMPSSQYYEIINPSTYETIDQGFTVPEPCSAILMITGVITFLRGRRKAN
jgi:hypothetical protein